MIGEQMQLPTIFSSESAFRQTFEQGLAKLLCHGGVGEFVLVCANASNEMGIQQHLKTGISLCFEQYERQFSEHPEGVIESAMDDDVAVFLHLEGLGIDNLEQSRTRREGDWELQFNQMRSFRPKRNAVKKMDSIRVGFDPDGFHFNKPFLREETVWTGELLGRQVDLLYNKFPFAELHGLLVIDRELCKPQYLIQEHHDYLWHVAESLGKRLAGIGFGYNATGAFSSVNHLHFQMFVREQPLAVELDHWQHNGGERDYPAHCDLFDNPSDSWKFIETLHAANITYNLLYRPGQVYCFPRKMQGSFQHSDWTTGFTWVEMAGEILVSDLEQYERLTSEDIELEYQKLSS
jgi:hypothetical protein